MIMSFPFQIQSHITYQGNNLLHWKIPATKAFLRITKAVTCKKHFRGNVRLRYLRLANALRIGPFFVPGMANTADLLYVGDSSVGSIVGGDFQECQINMVIW